MKRIPLNIYVAANNPKGAKAILKQFDLMNPRNQKDLARGLRHVMLTKGDEGFIAIAKAHPDKQLILDVNSIEATSNACGCLSNANGENMAHVPGSDNPELIAAIKDLKTKDKLNQETQLTKDDVAGEVKKALNEKNLFVKDALPYIALFGIGLFLFKGALN